jgi:hypothetical protein
MTIDLSTLENRVHVLLTDLTQLNYSAELIRESIRMALVEYQTASGTAETISGLDGAGQTTLPEMDSGLIVLGAAGFTASCKAIDRMQQFNLEDQTPEAVLQLGQRLLTRFDRLLGSVRVSRMRTGSIQAWGEGWGTV